MRTLSSATQETAISGLADAGRSSNSLGRQSVDTVAPLSQPSRKRRQIMDRKQFKQIGWIWLCLIAVGTLLSTGCMTAEATTSGVATTGEAKAGGFVLRIGCGSEKPYKDSKGNVWEADREYEKGKWGAVGGKITSRDETIEISGTGIAPLYRNERYGMSAYQV